MREEEYFCIYDRERREEKGERGNTSCDLLHVSRCLLIGSHQFSDIYDDVRSDEI